MANCYWCKKQDVTFEHVEMCRRPIVDEELDKYRMEAFQMIEDVTRQSTDVYTEHCVKISVTLREPETPETMIKKINDCFGYGIELRSY